MAALPFLITAATVAYVSLFPPSEERMQSSSSKALSSSFGIASNEGTIRNNPFWIGVGVGMTFTWLSSYEIKRRRLWQRARLKFLSLLCDIESILIGSEQKEKTKNLNKFRKPCRILHLEGTPIPRKSKSDNNCDNIRGSHLELVSPDWVPSSNFYCDIVKLPPETELVPNDAEGVEFYYVLKGEGIYVDRIGEKHQISAEDGFIVDPGWYVLLCRTLLSIY